MMHFHEDDIVIDLRGLKKLTPYLPRKWLWFALWCLFFLAWWFGALWFNDTMESIVAAGVAMFFAYKSIMCVAKAEDWKHE